MTEATKIPAGINRQEFGTERHPLTLGRADEGVETRTNPQLAVYPTNKRIPFRIRGEHGQHPPDLSPVA
jgi:hypothetical protein